MVFSSITSYLDPTNWQQANPQPGSTAASSSSQVLPALQAHGGGGGSTAIRTVSMAEKARMANIPMPETALKCPRCQSPNTKFCYYNNYNLAQPRHFCKTCRRYWTKGGALRNVPVGGGCRRNKRNKSSGNSSSKSTASTGTATIVGGGSSTSTTTNGPTTLLGLCPQIPPLRFMPHLSQLGEFIPGDIGLSYGGMSAPLLQQNHDMNNFPLGISNTSLGGGGGTFFQAAGIDSSPWRVPPCHMSSMAGLEGHGSGSIMFPFQEHSAYSNDNPAARPKLGVLKMEDSLQEMNLSRQSLGTQDHHHHQYSAHHNWGSGTVTGTSNSWSEISGFSSSSRTSNAL